MTLVTTPGLLIMDTCGAFTVVMWAWARWAMNNSSAGGMAWSAVPTTAQDGIVFQAGTPAGRGRGCGDQAEAHVSAPANPGDLHRFVLTAAWGTAPWGTAGWGRCG